MYSPLLLSQQQEGWTQEVQMLFFMCAFWRSVWFSFLWPFSKFCLFFNLLLSEELLYGCGVFITIASCLKKKHLDVIEYVLNFCSWSAPSFLGGRLWDVAWRRKILLLGTVNLKQYKGSNFSVIMLISRWEVRRETCFYLLFEIIKQLFQRDEVSCTKFTIYLCLSCKNI